MSLANWSAAGTLASDPAAALAAINTAHAAARATTWTLAGAHAPDHDISPEHPLIVDLDATLLTAHSDKQSAARTFKRGYGFHPLCSFVDHGAAGTGPATPARTPPPGAVCALGRSVAKKQTSPFASTLQDHMTKWVVDSMFSAAEDNSPF